MQSATVHNLNNNNDFLRPGDTVRTSDKQLFESPEVQTVAEKVIKEQKIELGPAQVCYMLLYPNISKKRAAKAVKCNRELRHFSGYDYLIEVSGELWDMLDERTKYMMLWHQLLHLDPVYKAKTQEWVMKQRKPEYTDYYEIADSKGSTWHKTVQATQSSLYDMDPRSEGQVSLF
jgi:hypothetical protein